MFLYFIEITWAGRICENGGKNQGRAGRAVWWPGICEFSPSTREMIGIRWRTWKGAGKEKKCM
jgi:hypothetical protein